MEGLLSSARVGPKARFGWRYSGNLKSSMAGNTRSYAGPSLACFTCWVSSASLVAQRRSRPQGICGSRPVRLNARLWITS
ncbi:hypothetical protein BDV28DRAFT_21198 [Aspergillus coremiiformis]|uniref:Uncharacterized protein n=1 Tax=Aspergillus coremiiformis TaxID=138285 RepID=A0A5N6Z3Y3_9EURO|nr:hypothetical protein BDV28DRAFT_21198 [Aspergillus coremiiformis]